MELERPRMRGAAELGFESQVLGKGVARTHALEALIIVGFLRGLSVRDVEALLEERSASRWSASRRSRRVCQDTRERYRAWCERELAEHDLVYCYLDAIYLKLRPTDEPAEGVLVAWGLTLEGQKVLLGLQLGSRESYESWLDFGRDLKARGMRAAGADHRRRRAGDLEGDAGAVAGRVEQRCTVHALRNITRKLPERLHREVKTRYWAVLDDADLRRRRQGRAARARRRLPAAYPSAMRMIDEHADQLVAHLRFPLEHRKRTRSDEPARAHVRRGPPAHQDHRPLPRRDLGAVADLGRAGARQPRLARHHDDPKAVAQIERLRRGQHALGEARWT